MVTNGYNYELCKERHDNINQEFTNVWDAINNVKHTVQGMNKLFISLLVGVILNLLGVIGILGAVTLGG
jgi:hypothetical protein